MTKFSRLFHLSLILLLFLFLSPYAIAKAGLLAQVYDATLTKSFNPSTMGLMEKTRLSITLTNPNAFPIDSVAWTDDLEGVQVGLKISTPSNAVDGCGGTLVANAGETIISLSGATLSANGSCTVAVDVVATVSGNLENIIPAGTLSGLENGGLGTITNASQARTTLNVANFDFPAEINKQFNPISIAPGDVSRLSVSIYNSNVFALGNASWTDYLDGVQPGLKIANPPNVVTDCVDLLLVPDAVVAVAGTATLSLSGGNVPAYSNNTPGSCTVSVDVTSITPGNLINTIPEGALSASGPGGSFSVGNTSPSSATLNVDSIVAPSITKSFISNTVWIGQTSVLTINIKNNDLTHALSEVVLTDTVSDPTPSSLVLASPVSASLTGCGTGVLGAVSGGSEISLTGAVIPANSTCKITVNVVSPIAGVFTNNIPAGAIQTRQGVTNGSLASAQINVQAAAITKAFLPTSIQAGEISVLTITLKNPSAFALTGATMDDVMPGTVLELVPDSGATTCTGGLVTVTTTNRTNDTLHLESGSIPAGSVVTPGSCTITANVTSPDNAGTAAHNNLIPADTLTTTQGYTNLLPSNTATLNLQRLSIGIVKEFAPTSIQQGGLSTLKITLQNKTSSLMHITSLTDTFPDGLVPVTPDSAATSCVGGSAVSSTSPASVTLTGGVIPTGTVASPGTCTITVNITTNGSTFPAAYTNAIGALALTTEEGATNQDPASSNINVYPTDLGITASKSFNPAIILAGTNSRLNIQIKAPEDETLTGFSITDNLPPNLLISNSTAASTASCGSPTLTAAINTGTISITNGTILKGATCQINVYVTSSVSGTYTNSISPDLFINDQFQKPPLGISSSLTVSHLTTSKSFYPAAITPGGSSTLVITLTNTNSSALTGVSLLDNLNTMGTTDFTIATTPRKSTTCGGTLSVTAGAQTITLANGTVPAMVAGVPGICVISVDITGSAAMTGLPTTRTNTLNRTSVSATVAGLGTVIRPVANSTAVLSISALTLGVVKGFEPLTVFGGSSSTLSVQLINPNNTVLTGIGLVDTMPAGMYVANPPNISLGTCGGSLVATPGSNVFTFSGGSLEASRRCTLTVDTTMNVNGNRTNTIPASSVTSFNGATNSDPAQASLTNLPGVSITKFFTPNSIIAGETATLTLRITNTGNIALSNLGFTDTLPVEISILGAPVPTNACHGSLSTSGGKVKLIGGSIAPGPGTTCDIVVSVTGTTAGTYTNIIGKNTMTSAEGATNTEPAQDTLVIVANPAMQLVKTLNIAASSPAPYIIGDTLSYDLVATNTGDITLKNVTITDPGVVMTCPTQDLLVGQALACTATHVVTALDDTAGTFTNTASADSDQTTPVTDSVSVPINKIDALSVKKVINTTAPYNLGDTLSYTITATNMGTSILSGVTIADTGVDIILGTCSPAQPAVLNPGTSMTCPATHVVTMVDVDAGSYVNTSTADSVQTDPPVTDSLTVSINRHPELKVYKQVTSQGPYTAAPATSITYDISALNTGDQTLHNVTLVDNDPGVTLGSCSPTQPATLAPGALLSCTASHLVVVDDITNGGYTNTATADSAETSPSTATVTVITMVPSIKLIKTGTLLDGGNGRADAGDTITYAFTITNTGQVTLTNVTLTDIVGGISISGGPIATLAAGAVDSATFTGSYVLTQADINAGTFTNTATTVGTPPIGSPVSSTASDTRTGLSVPVVTITKTGTLNKGANDRVDAGDTISYVFSVENTGNVALTNVRVTDPNTTMSGSPISLAIGASDITTFTGLHTLTQAEVDAGTFTNTATVTATPPTGADVTATDSDTQPLLAEPVITTTKTGTLNKGSNNRADAGDTISYVFTVANTGNVTLTNVNISDPDATITGGPITLLPGASNSSTFTGVHTLTQADVDAGTFTNTATASGKPPIGTNVTATDSDTQTLVEAPAITLVKVGTQNKGANSRIDVGETISYSLTVTNTGNVTLSTVTVTDPTISITGSPIASLAPGASSVLSGSYTITQDDIDTGTFTNTASTQGTSPQSTIVNASDGDTQSLVQVKTISLAKTGSLDMNLIAPLGVANPGDKINYAFTITNTGNVTLTNVFVTDPLISLTGSAIASMLPGAVNTITFAGSFTLTQTEIDAGTFTNTATVTGTPPSGPDITATDPDTQSGLDVSSITITKTGTLVKGVNNRVDVGDTITYVFTVTNTGNTNLTNVHISDPDATIVGGPISLAPYAEDSATFTGVHTLTQAEVDAGSFTNTATVTGTPSVGADVTGSDPDSQTLLAEPSITITKTGTLNKGVNNRADAGDTISYAFSVTNTGNVTLTAIGITDPNATISGGPISLAPGAVNSATFTGVHTLTQPEVDAGTFTNTATVTGTPPTGPTVTATDPDTQTLAEAPAITLVKVGTQNKGANSRIDVGETISYSLTVTNTGNVTLSNVTVTDPVITVTGSPVASLSPGASSILTGSYTLTQADIDAGSFTNTASTEGTSPHSTLVNASDGDTQTLVQVKTISLAKTGTKDLTQVAPIGVANPGDKINYTFTVTNTGNVTLTDVIVTDPLITVSGAAIASMLPGAVNSATFAGSYTLTQTEIDAGTFTNTATVTATPPSGANITATDPDTQSALSAPSVTITKTGTLVKGANNRVDVGDTITYGFTVTNTGNVALSNVRVADPNATITGGPISLAIGASDSSTFTGVHTLTQVEINSGTFTNTATVTGTPPTGANVTATDPDTQTLPADPAITIIKTGTLNKGANNRADAGDTISYVFSISNTGNVTLTAVGITDPNATITGGTVTLAPGATNSATFTGVHTLTQAEVNAGTFTNTATVSGKPPTGANVTATDPDTQTLLEAPAITLVKVGTQNKGANSRIDAGETISYSLTVTNTGNVTLSNVIVSDPTISITGSPIASLAPNASSILTGSYTVTQGDIEAGTFTNTASTQGTSPQATLVTATDGDTQTLVQVKTITLAKVGTQDLAVIAPPLLANPGDKINYTFTITNTGNMTLTNMIVTDPLITVTGSAIASMAPGAVDSATFGGSYTITQTEIDAGTFTNTATVTATPLSGPNITATDPDTQTGLSVPSISIVKTGTLVKGANNRVDAGDTIAYVFTVTNTGNATLTNVRVTDPKATITGGPISLGIGASDTSTFTGVHTLTQAEVDAGTFTNTATATGTPSAGPNVTSTDPDTQALLAEPSITITKTGTLNKGANNRADAGDTISYVFSITNTGNVTLTAVGISDPNATITGGTVTLAPGATNSATFTGVHTLTQAEVDAGTFTNTATVSGKPPFGVNVTATDPDTQTLVEAPAITLAKVGSQNMGANGRIDAGETISYNLTVTNTGNVTLSNVTVTDPVIGITGSPIASLAPGASSILTGSYTVTQANIDAGTFTNTASTQGTSPKTTIVNASGGDTQTLVQVKTISLLKTGTLDMTQVAPNGVANPGDIINYTFTVTNTGNVTLTNIIVTDPLITVTGTAIASMLPAAVNNATFAGSYSLTQANINAGTFTNTATVTATPPIGANITATDPDTQTGLSVPSVSITKTGTLVKGANNVADVGDTITYTFTVTNTGNVTLTNVRITDPQATITGAPITLAPYAQDTLTFTGVHTLTQAEVDAGTFTNTATVTGTPTVGVNVTATDPDTQALPSVPQIALTKTGTLVNGANGRADVGDTITYVFTVTNTGNVTLSAVGIADPNATITGGPIILAPGASNTSTFTGVHTLTQAEVDAGTFTNTATVTGTPPTGANVTATDPDTQALVAVPSISLSKVGTQVKGVNNRIDVNDTITYAFKVTNTGNVTLTNISIADPDAVVIGGPISLAPSQSDTLTFLGTHTLTQAEVNTGTFTNTATVTGTPPIGPNVTGSDPDTQTLLAEPSITVTKTGTLNLGANSRADVGDTISYAFSLTNTGNVTLTGVTITDPDAIITGGPITLAPGSGNASTFTGVHTLTQAEVDAGSFTNTATASGKPPVGVNVTATDPDTQTLVAAPSISLVKSGILNLGVNGRADAGDTISYAFTVTNTGNVTLSAVGITDPNATISGGPLTLAPGAVNSSAFTGTHTLTQAEVNAGTFTNTATTSGKPPVGVNVTASDPDTQTLVAAPAITMTKTGTLNLGLNARVDAGDTISYAFTVTNTGNVTLSNVGVSDPDAVISGGPISLLPAAVNTLAFTGTHTLTQAEVDAGTFTNTATVTGTPPIGGDVTGSDPDTQALVAVPSITLTKTGTLNLGVNARVDLGDTISYTFSVTNTGNVSLTNISISDPDAILNGGPVSLAPGATDSVSFTGSHTLTQVEVNAGTFTNTATVSGKPPVGANVSATDPDTQTLAAVPAITLLKTGTLNPGLDGRMDPGDTISYAFTVTNTGNVTLTNVSISDPDATVSGGPISMVPGAVNTAAFTASHTVNQAELDAGTFTNIATVTGTPPTGGNVTDNAADTRTFPALPAITVLKTGTLVLGANGRADAGDKINYTFSVTNSGNVTLSGVTINDPDATISGSPVSLAAGATDTATFTGVHTLNQAEVDAGTFTNTATVTGTPPVGLAVSATDTDTQTFLPVASITITKLGLLHMDVIAPNNVADVDDTITYAFVVKNTGNVTLSNVTVTDNNSNVLINGLPFSLAPGVTNSIAYTAVYSLQQADVDAGLFTNTADVVGTPPSGPNVTNFDGFTEMLTPAPAIEVIKTGGIDLGANGRVDVGEVIVYTFDVTNIGNVTLSNVSLSDPQLTDLAGGPITTLAINATDSTTFTGSHTITQADIDLGSYTNTATVTGTPPAGLDVTASSIDIQTLAADSSILLEKTGVLNMGTNQRVDAGDTISYFFKVINTGNTTLGNIQVSDPLLTVTGGPISLGSGESDALTFTGSYVLTQPDVDAGTFINTASVSGTPPIGTDVSDSASYTQPLTIARSLSLVVDDTPIIYKLEGDLINVTYAVTNSGNVTVYKPFTIQDGRAANALCPDTVDQLLPGEMITCFGSFVIVRLDISNGSATNSATAWGKSAPIVGLDVVSPPDSHDVTVAKPVLSIDKTAQESTYSAVGDVLHYDYLVTNTGNVPIYQPLTITDDKAADAACPSAPASLAVGETINCSGTYTVTQADLDNGSVVNVASVTGMDEAVNGVEVTSPTDTVTVIADQVPVLNVVKMETSTGPYGLGATIQFEIEVSNAGNLSLNNVTLVDPSADLQVCSPEQPLLLAPGDKMICPASHLVVAEDIIQGVYENIATADSNETLPVDASLSIPLAINPVIGLSKNLVKVTNVEPGVFDVEFEFLVQNYGDVDLTELQVSDDLSKTFPSPTSFTVLSLESPDFSVNVGQYNGDGDINLLSGTDTLAIGQSGSILLSLRLIPASAKPYNNSASAYGVDPIKNTVEDVSQDGSDPDPDQDGNPGNNNDPTPVVVGPVIFDPPLGLKIYDESGLPVLRWTMTWINRTNIPALKATVSDPVVDGTAFVPGTLPSGYPVPDKAPVGSTNMGVVCKPAPGAQGTSTTLCYYEGPTKPYPFGRIIWSGSLGPDRGATDEKTAKNEMNISFDVRLAEGVDKLENVALIETELGDAIPSVTVSKKWSRARDDKKINNLPSTGFPAGLVSVLPVQPQGYEYNAYSDLSISIPTLQLNADVVGVPVSAGSWDITWLGDNLGYLNGTAFPTWKGNSAITGHVTLSNGLPGPFAELGKLRWGDRVIVRAFSQEFVYEVRALWFVKPDDLSVLSHKDEAWLTLITCQEYDNVTGKYKTRVAVQAVLVSVNPVTSAQPGH